MSFMLGLKTVNLILRFILELRTYCCRLLCYSIKGRVYGVTKKVQFLNFNAEKLDFLIISLEQSFFFMRINKT